LFTGAGNGEQGMTMNNNFTLLIFKRIIFSIFILFLLVSFVFVLLRLSPGDISQKFISPKLSPELKEKVIESFGLNKGLPEQYAFFLANLFKGDLGVSYNYRVPVKDVIKEHLPFTLLFTFTGFLVQAITGIIFALIAVKFAGKATDRIISSVNLISYSIPTFVVGLFLIYIFSAGLDIFPSSGIISIDHDQLSSWGKITDYISHLFLPLIALAFGGSAVYFKYLRDNLEDIYNKPFVTNLRAYGMSEKKILLIHVIPNAINPLISIAGVGLGVLFGGALITEVVFGLPGMGRLSVYAILSRDYPLVIGCTLMAGFFIIASNLAADIIKAVIDKRLVKQIIN
jgi:peptide/nickel transport system permease protein